MNNPQTIGGVEALIAELRADAKMKTVDSIGLMSVQEAAEKLRFRAASTIEHQLSVIGELQRALKPFADFGNKTSSGYPDEMNLCVTDSAYSVPHPTLGDCRKAFEVIGANP